MAKIFISYKRNVEPDTPVATALFHALREKHEVFIDQNLKVGEKWGEQIQNAIKQSDYMVIFLSEYSVHSEMVIAEVEIAHHHNRTSRKPVILPVRLKYAEQLAYPLNAYLNPLQWAIWNEYSDTPRLINELQDAISGGELPIKDIIYVENTTEQEEVPTAFANILHNLGSPEGTMSHTSEFYIERDSDKEAFRALCETDGVTITIKGPRQMGKSSLLNRIMVKGCSQSIQTAFIDFQLIENDSIENPDIFYRQFCSLLSWEFEIEDRTEEFWKGSLGNKQKTSNYVQNHLLKELHGKKVLLAMDEVERMFASPFRSDFFSMLRSWHNIRARKDVWKRFNLALVTSTEPYQFIKDLNQSPFNVGNVVELSDFDQDQVFELNLRHGNPLTKIQTGRLFELLSGHPYLTRKAFYLIASQRITFAEMLKTAHDDDGPFGDHLRNHLFRMSGHENLKVGFVQVINDQRCPDEHVFFRLRGAGLVKRNGNDVLPRNRLYAEYFRRRLNG